MRDIDQEQLKENLRRHFAGKIDKNDNSIEFLNELVSLFNDSSNILDRIAPIKACTVTINIACQPNNSYSY